MREVLQLYTRTQVNYYLLKFSLKGIQNSNTPAKETVVSYLLKIFLVDF